jgi:peptidoglycan/LPS O-acetylase OafA/YrhL
MSETLSPSDSISISRRADLDAVRAFAMLLGIGLHAGLSVSTIPWIVQDSHRSDGFSLFFLATHGFRMPLFFLVSGFFTAMLWRRRGLQALLKQRATRILLPCLIGLVTIVPATQIASFWAIMSAAKSPSSLTDDGSLVAAVRLGEPAKVRERLEHGADVSAPDGPLGVPPLSWAAMGREPEVVRLLLEHGADVNGKNSDGSTPLHGAAFLGRVKNAELLIEKGARVDARNTSRQTPIDATKVNWETTSYLASLLNLPGVDKDEVEKGRVEVARLLSERATAVGSTAASPASGATDLAGTLLEAYRSAITSDRLNIKLGPFNIHPIQTQVFAHLWFLWFLCWLVPIFAVFAWAIDRFGWVGLPRWLVVSPARFLWLIPLTFIPQFFMGLGGASFGPDTSEGLVPMPHLLLYYGVFFAFGALYFDSDDESGRLGRWWYALLPAALLLALPLGLATMANRPVTSVAQVTYAWMMSFGVMGLFRKVLKRENWTIRYLSDASYWLYLTHLPLVIGAQAIVRDWPLPALVKFVLLCTSVTGFLLILYQVMVRYTWIGRILNGPRTRRSRSLESSTAAVPLVGLETT